MFGSEIFDVAIGLFLVFLILSLVASAIREALEHVLRYRARYLEAVIEVMLGNDATRDQFYRHPLIRTLCKGAGRREFSTSAPRVDPRGWFVRVAHRTPLPELMRRRNLPSYIPAQSFAFALYAVAIGKPASKTERDTSEQSEAYLSLSEARRRVGVNAVLPTETKEALEEAIDVARFDFSEAIRYLAAWYSASMDRLSGRYKRQSQVLLFLLGCIMVVGMDIDAVRIARTLYRDGTVRDALVARARQSAALDVSQSEQPEIRIVLQGIQLPIGLPDSIVEGRWDDGRVLKRRLAYVQDAWVGWLISILAVTLGAPFWFDMLNKFVMIRSSLKQNDPTPSDSSDNGRKWSESLGGLSVVGGVPAYTHSSHTTAMLDQEGKLQGHQGD